MGQRKKEGAGLKRERRKRGHKLNAQQKAHLTRAKYGPLGRPAPVVVKRLDEFGEWVVQEPVDPSTFVGDVPRYADSVEALARSAGYPGYDAYLHSSRWKALRRRVLERDGWRCRLCQSKRKLHVHHDRYDVSLLSGSIDHLKTMCERCHGRIHGHP